MKKIGRNKALIIASAKKLFSKYGFRKTTMDEIASEAGKGKSSLYYYYTSKEEVFAAVVEEESVHLQDKINKAIEAEQKASEKLKAYIKTSVRSIQEMANLNEAIQNEFLSHYTIIEQIRQKYYAQEVHTVEQILQLGMEKESFDLPDPAFTARAVVRVMKAMEIPLRIDMPERNLDEEIDKLMHMILYGILSR
ncbi:MAG: TetR/AcrR family transcriptional regulator [Bacteroidota bacterium]